MTLTGRRLLLFIPLGILLFLVTAYITVDAWLESAGGRRALEQELGKRFGVAVRMKGDFDIVLLPSIGVSGTDLEIASPTAAEAVARSSRYQVLIDLIPLLEKRVRVENFVLEDLHLAGTGQDADPIRIRKVEFRGFEESRLTPFTIETADLGDAEGEFQWKGGRSVLEMNFAWHLGAMGRLDLELATSFADHSGSLNASYLPAPSGYTVDLSTGFTYRPDRIDLTTLVMRSAGQEIRGAGCLVPGPEPELHLDLSSEFLDLDGLRSTLPVTGGGNGALPVELRIRLAVQQAIAGGAFANQAELELGGGPDCPGKP